MNLENEKKQRGYIISSYSSEFEESWVRCKALSYLYSQFNDQITANKDTFSVVDGYTESIELIAVDEERQVIGILDIGIFNDDQNENYPYAENAGKGSYMDIIAVHPDYQKQGIAQKLIAEALEILRKKGIEYISIFTRGDEAANGLYVKLGAVLVATNYRIKGSLKSEEVSIESFKVNSFAKKIEVKDSNGNEMNFMADSGYYWVYDESALDLFDVEDCIHEHSYILKL